MFKKRKSFLMQYERPVKDSDNNIFYNDVKYIRYNGKKLVGIVKTRDEGSIKVFKESYYKGFWKVGEYYIRSRETYRPMALNIEPKPSLLKSRRKMMSFI